MNDTIEYGEGPGDLGLDTPGSGIGLTPGIIETCARMFGPQRQPARVVKTARGIQTVAAAFRTGLARTTGAFDFTAVGPADYPCAGDFVAVEEVPDPSIPFRIHGILPRRSILSRKTAGRETVEQVLAANIDIVFIVMSLEGGRKCVPRSAERYATMAWDSGAVPVLLLNKADLCADTEGALLAMENALPAVDIILLSCVTGAGTDTLQSRLGPGTTAVLVGPSGTGKSTIVNTMLGTQALRTMEVREDDKRGRHTTTHRELIVLPSGGVIIDTPGLRELALWADEDSLDASFTDIADLSVSCRFRDCTHTGEPGCAVQAALADGSLEHERYENYLDLRKEIAYLKRRAFERETRTQGGGAAGSADGAMEAVRAEAARWKAICKRARGFTKEKRSGG